MKGEQTRGWIDFGPWLCTCTLCIIHKFPLCFVCVWERISGREAEGTEGREKVWPGVLCVSKPAPTAVTPGRLPAAPRLSAAELCQTRPTLWGTATGGMPGSSHREREGEKILEEIIILIIYTWKIIFSWYYIKTSNILQLGPYFYTNTVVFSSSHSFSPNTLLAFYLVYTHWEKFWASYSGSTVNQEVSKDKDVIILYFPHCHQIPWKHTQIYSSVIF